MAVDLISNKDKLAVLEEVCDGQRARAGRDDFEYQALRAIARDLKARLELPRSQLLGEIDRALHRAEDTRIRGRFHQDGQLINLGQLLMKHWPTIRQALEHFGEISAE